ncbi:MAG: 4-hydroxy-tetrahydrodipicolinate synthase [Simkaniaceae bacterium]|nr:4-hydroxy-tetrahydrodipicolinate synthase [Simkaniaceae bacterium]
MKGGCNGGTITALITPFRKGRLDEEGFCANVERQIAGGVEGILVSGTTGEGPTLSDEERERVVAHAVAGGKGKVEVWVGAGSNCTRRTIRRVAEAERMGADVALVVAPYYNKPTQEGMYAHFEAIARQTTLPLVAYNVPSRCGVAIEPDTWARIAKLPNVTGIKEASGSREKMSRLLEAGGETRLFSGDDALTVPMMEAGVAGVVSVASNILPEEVAQSVRAAREGRFAEAQRMHERLMPLYRALFVETNPIPIKAAMALCGMAAGVCRLPLSPPAPSTLTLLQEVLDTIPRQSVRPKGGGG